MMFLTLLRNLNLLFLTLFILSLFSFVLAFLFPGDPLENLSGLRNMSELQYAQIYANYGFEHSYFYQYWIYLGKLFDGDWGLSFSSGLPLWQELSTSLPASIELSVYSLLISLLIGIPLGFWAGFKHNKPLDYGLLAVSVVNYSLPIFWLALILILIFSLTLGWLPLSGRVSLLFDIPESSGFILLDIFHSNIENKAAAYNSALKHLILPTLSLTIITAAIIFRLTRRSFIDVMSSQYIKTAYTRGLSHFQVIIRHGVRNTLLPILPLFAMQSAVLLTNAMIVEFVYSWPGVGNWLIQAISQRDYPAIRAGMLAVSSIVIVVTISTDVLAKLINPALAGDNHAEN